MNRASLRVPQRSIPNNTPRLDLLCSYKLHARTYQSSLQYSCVQPTFADNASPFLLNARNCRHSYSRSTNQGLVEASRSFLTSLTPSTNNIITIQPPKLRRLVLIPL